MSLDSASAQDGSGSFDLQVSVSSQVFDVWYKLVEICDVIDFDQKWVVFLLHPLFCLTEKVISQTENFESVLRTVTSFAARDSPKLYIVDRTSCLLATCADLVRAPSSPVSVVITVTFQYVD